MPGQGQRVRLRGLSSLRKGRGGYLTPERIFTYQSVAAPGAVGAILFEAEAPCKIVRIRERHGVAGAGASVVLLHRHTSVTAAAPAAAVAAGITLTASIAADGSANVWRLGTLQTTEGTMNAGDTLMVITPITYANFSVQVTVVYLGKPVAALPL